MVDHARNSHVAVSLLAVGVVGTGILIAYVPRAALALVGLGVLVAIARFRSSTILALIIAITAIVPFGIQNRFGIGGGAGAAGLLPSDALLLAGLLHVAPRIFRLRPGRRLHFGAFLVSVFVAVAALQFLRGLWLGRDPSTVGAEFRVLLGFSTFLIAVPVVSDEAERSRLLRILPLLGLTVGIWGLAQWGLQLSFSEAGDAGVREGVRLTSAGRGQIQGGLFAFPVAVVLALAGIISGQVQRLRSQLLLGGVIVVNALCVLLTYERTFWVATTLACGWVVIKARGTQRARAVFGGTAAVILLFIGLSTLAPSELSTARERLLSLSQYGNDNSVRYRLAESGHVWDQIVARPVLGSGLGASIFWGRPWELVAPSSFTFAHNGYLWLAWKVGVPAAALLWILLGCAITWRGPPEGGPLYGSVRNGCQAALLGLVVTTVTFPSFNQLPITPTMGLLMAVCATRRALSSRDDEPEPPADPSRQRTEPALAS